MFTLDWRTPEKQCTVFTQKAVDVIQTGNIVDCQSVHSVYVTETVGKELARVWLLSLGLAGEMINAV